MKGTAELKILSLTADNGIEVDYMKIPNDDSVKYITQAYRPQVEQPGQANRTSKGREADKAGKDDISISELGKELQKVKRIVEAASDVRTDKVAELQKQIKEGLYRVPEEELIDRILGL